MNRVMSTLSTSPSLSKYGLGAAVATPPPWPVRQTCKRPKSSRSTSQSITRSAGNQGWSDLDLCIGEDRTEPGEGLSQHAPVGGVDIRSGGSVMVKLKGRSVRCRPLRGGRAGWDGRRDLLPFRDAEPDLRASVQALRGSEGDAEVRSPARVHLRGDGVADVLRRCRDRRWG